MTQTAVEDNVMRLEETISVKMEADLSEPLQAKGQTAVTARS